MNDYLTTNHTQPSDLIPANLGLSEASLSTQITEYNKLVLDRNRIVKNSSDKNPTVENLDAQIKGLRSSIKESLVNLIGTLEIKVREIAKKRTRSMPKLVRSPNTNANTVPFNVSNKLKNLCIYIYCKNAKKLILHWP